MKFELKAYNLQELGQRQNQEDSLYPAVGKQAESDRVFVLCDGMGGHEKGEVASATVCQALSQSVAKLWSPDQPLTDELFGQALDAAYDALDAKDCGGERKMGTTMTFLCLHSAGATVAHIGDSRVYQLRPAAGSSPASIVFRTQDHSLVNDLVRVGEITEQEARHHPQKNIITRAMQPHQERRAKADIVHLTDIRAGDYFYLCSDGMLEEATDEDILSLITSPSATNEQKIEMLRGATERNKDNHTAHLVYISQVEGADLPSAEPQLALVTPAAVPPQGASAAPDLPAIPKPQPSRQPKRKRRALLWLAIGAVVASVAIAIAAWCRQGKAALAAKAKHAPAPSAVRRQPATGSRATAPAPSAAEASAFASGVAGGISNGQTKESISNKKIL